MGMLCGLHHYNHTDQQYSATITVGAGFPHTGWWALTGTGSIDENFEIASGKLMDGVISTQFYDLIVYVIDAGQELAQNSFTSIIIEDGDGVERTYNTADAALFSWSTGRAIWWFGAGGGDRVYELVDAGEDHPFRIVI